MEGSDERFESTHDGGKCYAVVGMDVEYLYDTGIISDLFVIEQAAPNRTRSGQAVPGSGVR